MSDKAKILDLDVSTNEKGILTAKVTLDDGRKGEADGLRWLSLNSDEVTEPIAIDRAVRIAQSKSVPGK